ncbi:MAG: FHA domain-containing protein [Propionibacteriaceae bacterium]|jgi:pSer/pThr/pTyr-binding forkhead associated (FHA) protein|nr:FHA domain-containing protein [Propionibacteriaceae bacterium]
MSELIVLGLKLGFLALLWLFILITGNVIRTDMFGRRVSPAELTAQTKPRKARRSARKLPHTLNVTHGSKAGTVLELGGGLLIGRGAECQLVLDDDYVSTRHARIVAADGGYSVEDMGSTNGTFVNNSRVSQPTPVVAGDTLRIGRTLMKLEK